jgi:hypothetical protein
MADGPIAPGQDSVFLRPGSNAKLVAAAAGRIRRSFTTLAGWII